MYKWHCHYNKCSWNFSLRSTLGFESQVVLWALSVVRVMNDFLFVHICEIFPSLELVIVLITQINLYSLYLEIIQWHVYIGILTGRYLFHAWCEGFLLTWAFPLPIQDILVFALVSYIISVLPLPKCVPSPSSPWNLLALDWERQHCQHCISLTLTVNTVYHWHLV